MTEAALFPSLVIIWTALALIVLPILFFIPAKYGRYLIKQGWSVPDAWGWVIMEAPAALMFTAMFLLGSHTNSLAAWIFLLMWMSHYIQRTFIYPFSQRKSQRRMPWQIVSLGFMFNMVNGYLNGRYLFEYSGGYPREWLLGWNFLLGAGLFVIGYGINRSSDRVLRDLREHSTEEYTISSTGLYRWVSCPNYLGEVVLWIGWAVATRSMAGLAFAVWTVANLAPRAWAHHRWYHQQFEDYPPERKAMLPGIW